MGRCIGAAVLLGGLIAEISSFDDAFILGLIMLFFSAVLYMKVIGRNTRKTGCAENPVPARPMKGRGRTAPFPPRKNGRPLQCGGVRFPMCRPDSKEIGEYCEQGFDKVKNL